MLNGVYHPERLSVLNPCKRVSGRVSLIREHEEDGDLHFDIAVKSKSLLRSGNYGQQEGLLVVEFMPRDFGHLPAPSVGDRVTLLGAWVDDTQHSWNEVHPVWAVSINGGTFNRSGPQFGGDPSYARSANALALCRTSSGSPCTGYSGGGATTSRPEPIQKPAGGSSGGGKCAPGYSPCLPVVGDLNCDQIPASKKPVKVTGSDPYNLDADGDGIGCESG